MAAATMPMVKVSIPARHHGIGDHRLRMEQIKKKVSPVMAVETVIDAGVPSTKGKRGTEPQTTKARKVVEAALAEDRLMGGSPCSSVIMVSIQRSRLAVMTLTAASSASPSKPLP